MPASVTEALAPIAPQVCQGVSVAACPVDPLQVLASYPPYSTVIYMASPCLTSTAQCLEHSRSRATKESSALLSHVTLPAELERTTMVFDVMAVVCLTCAQGMQCCVVPRVLQHNLCPLVHMLHVSPP